MKTMRMTILGAVAAAVIGVAAAPAMAEGFNFSFDVGNVAYAYKDGYWDSGHKWHAWHNTKEAAAYRDEHKEHYNDWKHDRDKDMGWHDK